MYGLFVRVDNPFHQIAHGDHTDNSLVLQYRQVAHQAQRHDAHTSVNSRLWSDVEHGHAHDLTHTCFAGLPALENDFTRIVTLGDDANQLFFAVEHHKSTDIVF